MERFGLPSHRVFSVRSILTFALVVVVTTLLWVLIGGQASHAADPTAAWSGDAIVYNNHGYNKATDFKDASKTIPAGSTVYTTPQQTVDGSSDKKVFILYFSPGVDPPTATTVKYIEFNVSSSNTTSNPQNARDVTITLKGTEDDSGSSCSVQGIGWIICPVSTFIASGMDNLFSKVLAPMMAAQPSVLGDPNNSMYIAWNIMRNIANIAFVIVFLIIIYSQLTNFGVSNYGLKKLIPRLIVAAVLVNLSFIVTAVAIDVSNIFGYSIQNIFVSISKSVFHLTNDNVSGLNSSPWTAVTAAALGVGGVIGGIYYVAGAGLWVLLPLLLGVIGIIILVIVVLAARQAIIVILVIIAPLAFVAYLLPNTEKWFDKWKDLFLTMLIFFPAFSLVFGGSQLAGQIIIQNAGDNLVMLIFGLAVQVAPLVITPMILKFSGSLLGKIAQITNNPSKGILDRSKNWAKDRSELTHNKAVGKDLDGRSKLNPLLLPNRAVKANEFRRRGLKTKIENAKASADNEYHKSPGYDPLHLRAAEVETDKNAIHDRGEAHIEQLRRRQGSTLYDRSIRAQDAKQRLEGQKNETSAHYAYQSTLIGTPLNVSGDYLEATKDHLQTNENLKSEHLKRQRTVAGSVLNRTVAPLETSKLWLEQSESSYTNMVENMKLNPSSTLYTAAQHAQASKEQVEATQQSVQALFDTQRRTKGTALNVSTEALENAKQVAEASKTRTTAFINNVKADDTSVLYRNVIQTEEAKSALQESESNLTRVITDLKSNETTPLHRANVRAENAKLAAQVSETRLGRIIEEYKTGELARTDVELNNLMESMVASVVQQAAETQGSQAAKNIQTKKIAEAFTEVDPTTGLKTADAQALLDIAASVDPNGQTRASANAISQLGKLEQEALTNNVTLLQSQAVKEGTTIKNLAKLIFQRHTGEDLPAGEVQAAQDPSIIEAAMEALAQDGDISTLRKARMNTTIDQSMMTRLFARNSTNMKTKGGFDLQANPNLAGASRETMDASIAATLGDVAASAISGQKAGWWEEVSNDISRIYDNAENYTYDADPTVNAKKKADNMKQLKQTYHNVTAALTNPTVLKDLGDRIEETIKIHQFLHSKFNEPDMVVDYEAARRGQVSMRPRP